MMIAMKFHVLDMWWIVLQRGHSLKNPVCTNNDLLSAVDVHPFRPYGCLSGALCANKSVILCRWSFLLILGHHVHLNFCKVT